MEPSFRQLADNLLWRAFAHEGFILSLKKENRLTIK